MCIGVRYSNLLHDSMKRLNEEYERFNRLCSEYDSKVNTLYHEIETNKYNAAQGYKKLMELKKVLQKRRIVKHEFAALQNLVRSFDVSKTMDNINKTKQRLVKSDEGNQEYRSDWNITLDDVLNESAL